MFKNLYTIQEEENEDNKKHNKKHNNKLEDKPEDKPQRIKRDNNVLDPLFSTSTFNYITCIMLDHSEDRNKLIEIAEGIINKKYPGCKFYVPDIDSYPFKLTNLKIETDKYYNAETINNIFEVLVISFNNIQSHNRHQEVLNIIDRSIIFTESIKEEIKESFNKSIKKYLDTIQEIREEIKESLDELNFNRKNAEKLYSTIDSITGETKYVVR